MSVPETPPAPQAGDEEQREEDSGKEKLGPGWEPGELHLHGPATVLQVLPGWMPQFLAFLAIHALCSIFPSGVRNPYMYFSAEERPWLLL